MPEQTPRAFFSYSRHDSEFVLKLAKDLREAGAAVWLDQLDINPGEHWDSALEKALADFPTMLLVLSPSSVESTNVMDEVSFALEENKLVIPLLYHDCKIPFRLRRLQHIDIRVDYEKGLSELLRILGVVHRKAEAAAVAASPTTSRQDTQVWDKPTERAAIEKADQERIRQERAEAERRATERSAADVKEREMAEEARTAHDKAEAERLAQDKVDQERIADQKAEAERQSATKGEEERPGSKALEVLPVKVTQRTLPRRYLIAVVGLVFALGLWGLLRTTTTPSGNNVPASVHPEGSQARMPFTRNTIKPDSTEWVKQFLSAWEGPDVDRLRPYFNDVVSPYLSQPNARWDMIENDKRNYFRRFPTIHYALVGQPTHATSRSGGDVLEFDIEYSNVRNDGQTLKGRSHMTVNISSVDGRWRIGGISERKVTE